MNPATPHLSTIEKRENCCQKIKNKAPITLARNKKNEILKVLQIINEKMTLVVLVGNVGTGKTTFCNNLRKVNRIIICPDKLIGSPETRQMEMITMIETSLKSGKTVIIDGVNLTQRARDFFLYFAVKAKCKTIIFDFGKGNEKTLNKAYNREPDYKLENWKVEHERNMTDYERPNYDNDKFDKIVRKH